MFANKKIYNRWLYFWCLCYYSFRYRYIFFRDVCNSVFIPANSQHFTNSFNLCAIFVIYKPASQKKSYFFNLDRWNILYRVRKHFFESMNDDLINYVTFIKIAWPVPSSVLSIMVDNDNDQRKLYRSARKIGLIRTVPQPGLSRQGYLWSPFH